MDDGRAAGPILPPHIEATVDAIAALHQQHAERAGPVQRVVDRSVQFIGRPRFVALLATLIVLWIAANVGLGRYGQAFDPLPFPLLIDVATALGLFITVLILIQQRHDDQLTGLREQLTLELAILGEQKSAKIIDLLEELRRDMPHVRDRVDHQAAALAVPADPQAVLDALLETQGNDTTDAAPSPPGRA